MFISTLHGGWEASFSVVVLVHPYTVFSGAVSVVEGITILGGKKSCEMKKIVKFIYVHDYGSA